MEKVMNKEHTIWAEKYRPTSLDTYIGNEHLKSKVEIYLKDGDIPHLLLYGPAGTGKTTLAKILSNSIECDYLYLNASDEGGVDKVRNKIKNFTSTIGFKDLKVVILDEADFVTPEGQAALRNLMETFAKHSRFILTCNYSERIIDPIQSRCQSFQIIPPSKKEVALKIQDILDAEKIEYSLDDIVLNVNSGYPDIRRTINSIQRQSINGKLVVDKRSIIENDYKLKLLEILKTQDKKNAFGNIRMLLSDSKIKDYADCFRLLFDSVDEYAKGHISTVILILAEGQRNDVLVPDKEINFMATIINVLKVIK
jgi:replication factor C small subunit|tara:strand:+ start:672 stop:1604 length:933 start_codon:yes stop_codon:yes gene_type:complete